MPFGYSTSDQVTRDMDFTFTGIEFAGGNSDHIITEPNDFGVRFTS